MASDMALEIIGDFSIVWFLSPALSLTGRPSSSFARWTAALPGSSLQVRVLLCVHQIYMSSSSSSLAPSIE